MTVVDEWNSLSQSFVSACTVDTFKVRLDLFMGCRPNGQQ